MHEQSSSSFSPNQYSLQSPSSFVPISQYTNTPLSAPPYITPSQKISLIAISVIALIELVLIIILLSLIPKANSSLNLVPLVEEDQDDSSAYKVIDIDQETSESMLLIYNASKNNYPINSNWSSKLQSLSREYSEAYSKTPLPDSFEITSASASPATSNLFPYSELRRVFIETPTSCAKFDFSTDFLSLESYDLADSCEEIENAEDADEAEEIEGADE